MAENAARESSDYNVRAVERAVLILDCFAADGHPRGISEIAQEVGLHKATVHRIAATLAGHGYLERLPGGTDYQLGVRIATLGARVLGRMDLRREALSEMRAVSQASEMACDLGIFDRGEVLVIEVVRGPHGHALASALWHRMPAHATSAGKLFLAHLPDDIRETLLERPLIAYTPRTQTSAERLRAELEIIRAQGYALDDEEYEVGVRAVSAPIRNSDGEMAAALSIPGPAARLTLDRVDTLSALALSATATIARRMGWQAAQRSGE